ncbi:hypothetical protein ELI54_26805 (plasmid) [Rhizobium ruizarguesonis]|nr:hypothetical protein ELI56_33700 [Rhizobium ruizarguesonis]TCA30144.1 hypothetical protein E0H70_16225 [Rhizobium leguminosarum bv. viciae]TAT74261.1 hypothetical protein ELI52_31155 [Rhizobium ruizarguesonis]TAT81809.1 hypothetical protein ELI54_26805 [Rhizobium ruizarguesonis]TAT93400.1 hypothetical protein ELI53_31360 [Rhizobium ruizarguesonis]
MAIAPSDNLSPHLCAERIGSSFLQKILVSKRQKQHLGAISDVLDEGGPLANAPKTWSFIKARDFLARHLLANDSI